MVTWTRTAKGVCRNIYSICSRSLSHVEAHVNPQISTISIKPLTGAAGAEINGVNLNRAVSARQADELRDAFHEYLVLIFRNQTLDREDIVRIAELFGDVEPRPVIKAQYGPPKVHDLVREPSQLGKYGEIFHQDCSYLREPPLGALLYGLEVPSFGNDTVFANMYLAVSSLSEQYQAMLAPLRAIHSAFKQGEYVPYDQVEHPVLRTHPVTNQRALFVNPFFTQRIAGMSSEESRSILDHLFTLPYRPELQCRVRWRPGTLTVWDNRCTQHMAIRDYTKERRVMRRIEVKGSIPI